MGYKENVLQIKNVGSRDVRLPLQPQMRLVSKMRLFADDTIIIPHFLKKSMDFLIKKFIDNATIWW